MRHTKSFGAGFSSALRQGWQVHFVGRTRVNKCTSDLKFFSRLERKSWSSSAENAISHLFLGRDWFYIVFVVKTDTTSRLSSF